MTKFYKLQEKLLENKSDNITFTKEELNNLIDGGLREDAFSSRSYFANDSTHAIYLAWRRCGYYCSKIDRINQTITLTKVSSSYERLLSSGVLSYYFKSVDKLDFVPIITPFAFAEASRTIDTRQDVLKQYLLDNNAVFVDFDGKRVTFDEFYNLVNFFSNRKIKLVEQMSNTYNNFVMYVFATCLLNVGVDVEELVKYFSNNKNMELDYFNPINNRWLLRNEFNKICKDLNFQNSVFAIKKLDIKQLQRFFSSASPLQLLFYDYAVDNFINRYISDDAFVIETSLVEEMLNVELLNLLKNSTYVTDRYYTSSILVSSIKNRIITI